MGEEPENRCGRSWDKEQKIRVVAEDKNFSKATIVSHRFTFSIPSRYLLQKLVNGFQNDGVWHNSFYIYHVLKTQSH